ncbi:unnamed protein product [Calicophoron daubneyi]|uniref:Uncharacterized protein n=1 Tax=Calicophoron daubneyi TaxID=300641 RepID=A0AAV2TIV0_CALDB
MKAAFAGRLSSDHPESRQELDIETKCNVIRTQSLLLEKDMKKYMEKCEQILAEFRLEGYNIRFSEIFKLKEDFACSIICGGCPVNACTVEAECLLRYQENYTRGRDALISKYKLQNPLLRNRLRRMERQTRQIEMTDKQSKMELDAIRHENESCMDQLRTVSKEIMQTKALGLTISMTAQYEWEKLKVALQENTRTIHETWRKKSVVKSIQEQLEKHSSNDVAEAFVNRRLLRKVKYFRAPSVWNFIDAILEGVAIDKEFKIAERRRYISQIIHNKNKRLLLKFQSRSEQPSSSGERGATSGYEGFLENGKRRRG